MVDSAPSIKYYKCTSCAAVGYVPRMACPECGGVERSQETSNGRGRLLGVTCFRGESPYKEGPAHAICIVELEEEFKVLGLCATNVEVGAAVRLGSFADHTPIFRSS
jgi:uncharacterized OB-fold protein